MISERSCDTEEWSNDAENTALITEINYIKKNIEIKVVLNSVYIWLFNSIFYQMHI